MKLREVYHCILQALHATLQQYCTTLMAAPVALKMKLGDMENQLKIDIAKDLFQFYVRGHRIQQRQIWGWVCVWGGGGLCQIMETSLKLVLRGTTNQPMEGNASYSNEVRAYFMHRYASEMHTESVPTSVVSLEVVLCAVNTPGRGTPLEDEYPLVMVETAGMPADVAPT